MTQGQAHHPTTEPQGNRTKNKDVIRNKEIRDMTKEDIRAMLLKGERVTLEAKLAERNVPKSVWDTYSAFANTIGFFQ